MAKQVETWIKVGETYDTSRGTKARVICVDACAYYPVVALEWLPDIKREVVFLCDERGNRDAVGLSLIRPPLELWVNEYRDDLGVWYEHPRPKPINPSASKAFFRTIRMREVTE